MLGKLQQSVAFKMMGEAFRVKFVIVSLLARNLKNKSTPITSDEVEVMVIEQTKFNRISRCKNPTCPDMSLQNQFAR